VKLAWKKALHWYSAIWCCIFMNLWNQFSVLVKNYHHYFLHCHISFLIPVTSILGGWKPGFRRTAVLLVGVLLWCKWLANSNSKIALNMHFNRPFWLPDEQSSYCLGWSSWSTALFVKGGLRSKQQWLKVWTLFLLIQFWTQDQKPSYFLWLSITIKSNWLFDAYWSCYQYRWCVM
jgi:hypothetical protein